MEKLLYNNIHFNNLSQKFGIRIIEEDKQNTCAINIPLEAIDDEPDIPFKIMNYPKMAPIEVIISDAKKTIEGVLIKYNK